MVGMDLPGLTETQILTKAYFAWESKARPGRKSSEELHETVFTLGKGKPYCNGESLLVSSLPSHELSPPMADCAGPQHQEAQTKNPVSLLLCPMYAQGMFISEASFRQSPLAPSPMLGWDALPAHPS